MQLTTLQTQSRKLTDSRANVRIRKQGLVPAVYYGGGQAPVHVTVNADTLRNVFAPGKRYTLLDLEIDGKTGNPALIHDYQKDALTQKITHVDFLRISDESVVKVRVAVRLVGVPVGVKTEGGLLQQEKRYIYLNCKPSQIPTELVVNVEESHAGTTFYAKEMPLGEATLASQPRSVIYTISKGRGEDKNAATAGKKDEKK